MPPKYVSGADVHIGERIVADGMPGQVVFVVDHREYSAEFPEAEWSYLRHGYMFRGDDGTLIHYISPDDATVLIARRGGA